MHPEILRELTSQRGREMRDQAHQAELVRMAGGPGGAGWPAAGRDGRGVRLARRSGLRGRLISGTAGRRDGGQRAGQAPATDHAA